MVYVALTVASLSAVIMCCVWFFKHRLDKNRYGTVSTDAEHVELNSRDAQSDEEEEIDLTDSGSKTAVPAEEYKDAFTLEDPGSSSESDDNDEGDSDERGLQDGEQVARRAESRRGRARCRRSDGRPRREPPGGH